MTGEQYEDAIDALASSAEMRPERAARIEGDLLKAFAEHHGARVPAGRQWARARWRSWLAAAAILVTVAGGFEVLRTNAAVTQNHVAAVAPPPVSIAGSPASVAPADRAPSMRVSRPSLSPHRVSPGRGRRAVSHVVRPSGFVALPGTAGLPQFESGTILRVELPVASLPAYGVDISPAADDQPVQADVLVGQDGEPRAIRLVTTSSRSGQ